MKIAFLLLLLTSFSCRPSGSEDFTSTLDSLADKACKSSDSRTIHLGFGKFYFKSPPKPFSCALHLIGDGIGSTQLIRNYQGNTFLYWTRGTDWSGGSVRDVTILAAKGTNKGIAIIVEALEDDDNQDNSYNRHTFLISNVHLGREDGINTSWDNGIYLDGSKNPDGRSGFAPGIRMTQIVNTTISGTNISQIYLNKSRGTNLLNVDCFIPLNGSFSGVIVDNNTQGVKLDSRSCAWRFNDNQSNWMVYNGIRFK